MAIKKIGPETDYSSCLVIMTARSESREDHDSGIPAGEQPRIAFYERIFQALRGSDLPVQETQKQKTNSLFLTSHQQRESTDELDPGTSHLIPSTMFDDAWLLRTHTRARTAGRRSGALIGACVGAVGLLALGPVLMLLCGIGGCVVGFGIGGLYDMNRSRRTRSDAEKELRRLTYLVRFAIDQIHRKSQGPKSQQYCCQIIQEVILEFRPLILFTNPSPVVLKKLKLFYSFLRDQEVEEYLWMMLNEFLSTMTSVEKLAIPEFIATCQNIFVPLVEVEKRLHIASDRRMDVIVKIEEFIADPMLQQYIKRTNPPPETTGMIDPAVVQEQRRPRRGSVYLSPRNDEEYFDGLYDVESEGIVRMSSRVDGSFFRNFDDFMQFDLELKHKMPISESEFKFLYEKEAESLKAPGWELTVDKRHIKVLRYCSKDEMSTSVLVRAYARIPKTSSSNVFYHIYDPNKRQSWDKNFSAISIVSGCGGGGQDAEEILYCQLQAPFGITPRDFLQYRKAAVVHDSICILMRSAEHENHPHLPGFIRAESLISGYIIRQNGDDCDLFLMSQTDIKGLIPKWIVNMVAAKAPAQWVESLTISCDQSLAKQFSNNAESMNDFLAKFLTNVTQKDFVSNRIDENSINAV